LNDGDDCHRRSQEQQSNAMPSTRKRGKKPAQFLSPSPGPLVDSDNY